MRRFVFQEPAELKDHLCLIIIKFQIKNHHIVFYCEKLEDINLLLEGKIDNYLYFSVKETDNFLAVLEEKIANIKGIISLSIVCHGTEKGLKIGRDVFDENKIFSFNTFSLKAVKINEIFLYSCLVGKM